MNCREVIGFLADYIENALAPQTRAAFEDHLRLCDSCTAYLASYRETIVACRVAESRDLPQDVPEELIEAILRSM